MLGRAGNCTENGVELAHLAGRFAAYTRTFCGYDTQGSTLVVRRLSDGKFVMARPATTKVGVEGNQSVGSLVLKPDSAVAWIATAHAIFRPRFVRQLVKLDERGFRVLDSGRSVAVGSLTLRGSETSWRHGHAIRTAKLL